MFKPTAMLATVLCVSALLAPTHGLHAGSITRSILEAARRGPYPDLDDAQLGVAARLSSADPAAPSPMPTPVPESWYNEQTLDHYNVAVGSQRTWSQRYFVREDFFQKRENAPVFLCVGGEGPPLTGYVLINSVHCSAMVELGERLGALLVALEHRYYGPSVPTADLSTPNLQWLSAHQALGDIAQFMTFIQEQYNLTSANKIVSWGGSYPGMLAGWARYNFPHIFHAAVSSSAPVHAELDFQGYNEVVGQSMAAPIVGGSQQCLDVITQGHAEIGDMLKTSSGRASLTKMFNICDSNALESADNQADWAGQGVVYLMAQENDPACTAKACNISGVCEIMLDTSLGSNIDRLAALSKLQHDDQCVDVNHNEVIASLTNTTKAGGVGRIWFWQTCTEFAFYQTCESGTSCPYTQGLNTLDANTELCKVAFDLDPESIAKRVAFSEAFWGGVNPQGARIMYPNGQIDPWHYLGVLKQPDPQEPVLYVEGASHHFWTHPSLPTDTPQIVAAREAIWKQVTMWLDQE